MAYQKKSNVYLLYSFIPVFILISSQSIIGEILPNLWQRHLEKPLLLKKVDVTTLIKY